jgi:hypothetical protein
MDNISNIYNSNQDIIINIDNLGNEISEPLIDNQECQICYEKIQKKKICNKCNYKMCEKCEYLYIKKYKYNSCPHCREKLCLKNNGDIEENILHNVIIEENNRNNKSCLKEICSFIFKCLFSIVLFILSIMLGSKILGDKHHKIMMEDAFVGLLCISILFICLSRCFCGS